MKRERDYVARLVVYDLPNMSPKQCRRLLEWLKEFQKTLKNQLKYSDKFVAKLYLYPEDNQPDRK